MFFGFTVRELLWLISPLLTRILALMLVVVVASVVFDIIEMLAEKEVKQPGMFYITCFGIVLPAISVAHGSGIFGPAKSAGIALAVLAGAMFVSNTLTTIIVTLAPAKYRAKDESRAWFEIVSYVLILSTVLSALSCFQ